MKIFLKYLPFGFVPLTECDSELLNIQKLKVNGVYEVDLQKKIKYRTPLLNRALHKYYGIIADSLNDQGQTFSYEGFKGEVMEIPFTPSLIKETLWRPIQMALFNIESTTKINYIQINKIIDVITLHFAKQGIELKFPSKENQIIDYENNNKHTSSHS